MTKIYLAGPMRGIKDFNFPLFHAAAKALREQGHEVFNPAEAEEAQYGVGFAKSEGGFFADIPHFDFREALERDCSMILGWAEAIALLPGWEKASGAQAEYLLAKAIGLRIIELKIETLQ